MKTLFFLSIVYCFLRPSLSQADTCTTCGWGMMTTDAGVQFRDSEAEANSTRDSLASLGITLRTAAEACGSENACGANSTCRNLTSEFFECNCEDYFTATRAIREFTCEDIGECDNATLNNCSSNANCTEMSPGFECTCLTGFTGDGTTCDDIDECTDATDDCDNTNANCTNTNGSYDCACHTGFSGDGRNCTDIDECTEDSDNCDTNANCTNTEGSYTCACITGYQGDGFTCNETDECAENTDNCSTNANCTNTVGSYDCVCETGYSGDGFNCTDIDECGTNTDNCADDANCTNTEGSFTCECDVGYTGNGATCVDIDECTDNLDNCSDNANCNNTDGSYTCDCMDGYSGDGFNCTDIDECATNTDNCSSDANCTNTDGGFDCVCEVGYTGGGDTCQDIDECTEGTDDCHINANCTNTNGSFTCECQVGYTGNGTSCEEINECDPDPCHANANCTDMVNDYNCTCNPGYTGNGTFCEDIDECTDNTDDCHDNATCTNTDGNHTCACDPGFTGNGYDCTPIDECASDPCDADATCTDGNNNFTCECNTGFSGDGFTCERTRVNINISFYITFDNVSYDTTLNESTSPLYSEVTGLAGPAISTFVQGVDSGSTQIDVNAIEYDFSTSADGLGYAECNVVVFINNTNIVADEYLRTVNTISIPALNASASADECTLEIDGCATGRTCEDTPYGFCCFHDIGGRFNITINETFDSRLQTLDDAFTLNLTNLITTFMNDTFIPPLQARGCLGRLSKSATCENYFDGSILTVLALLLNGATFTLQDINDELNKLAGETTDFGTILSAGDFDECVEDYLAFRNCSELAECLNFAGDFTCECNATYYDNGTNPGEICINPITVGCGGNIMNVSILVDYYSQQNISLENLHLANEICNRTTHATLVGDSIEFSVDINECNTTLAYSADNTSIIASNYITNLPSSGVFTGVEIVVPFECSLPVDVNITVGLNGSVDTVRLPNSQASGEFNLEFSMFTSDTFTTAHSSSNTYASTDTLYGQVAVQNNINGISVKVTRCFGTPTESRTEGDQFSFISDGCSNDNAVNFNMISNGDGNARFSMQMFFFREVNAAYLHCEAQVCTPSCRQSCTRRRRKRSTADFTKLVFLTLPVLLDPNDPMFNNLTYPIIGVNRPGQGGNSDNFTHDIALPIISAVLAFVLIVLLALLVLVVVRKRRSSQENYGVKHVNMHAIGVNPPEY